MNHFWKQRQGDEFYCHTCDKRWGINEETPVCIGFDFGSPVTSNGGQLAEGFEYPPETKPVFDKDEALCLIGLLTSKLACHESGSEIVKNAIQYLERQTA